MAGAGVGVGAGLGGAGRELALEFGRHRPCCLGHPFGRPAVVRRLPLALKVSTPLSAREKCSSLGCGVCARVLSWTWLQPCVIRYVFNVILLWAFFSGMEERGGGGIICADGKVFPGGAGAGHQVGYSHLLVSAPLAPYPPRGWGSGVKPQNRLHYVTPMDDPLYLPGALSHSHLPMLPGLGWGFRGLPSPPSFWP